MFAVLTRSVLISCAALVTPVYGCSAVPKAGEPVVNPSVRGDNTEATLALSAVYFEPDIVDLGDQLWKENVPFTLTVYNAGPAPVRISTLKTSCGCTVFDSSEWAGATIPPQGAKDLNGLLATGPNPGEQIHSANVELDDGRVCRGAMRINVVGTYTLSSRFVTFSDVTDLDIPDTQTVKFSSEAVKLAATTKVSAEWLEVHVVQRSGNEADITIKLLREAVSPGCSVGRIELTTTCARAPIAIVTVQTYYPTTLIAVPRKVLLQRGREAKVHLRPVGRRGDEQCRAQQVTSLDSRVDCRIDDKGIVRLKRVDESGKAIHTYVVISDREGNRTFVVVTSDADARNGHKGDER